MALRPWRPFASDTERYLVIRCDTCTHEEWRLALDQVRVEHTPDT